MRPLSQRTVPIPWPHHHNSQPQPTLCRRHNCHRSQQHRRPQPHTGYCRRRPQLPHSQVAPTPHHTAHVANSTAASTADAPSACQPQRASSLALCISRSPPQAAKTPAAPIPIVANFINDQSRTWTPCPPTRTPIHPSPTIRTHDPATHSRSATTSLPVRDQPPGDVHSTAVQIARATRARPTSN